MADVSESISQGIEFVIVVCSRHVILNNCAKFCFKIDGSSFFVIPEKIIDLGPDFSGSSGGGHDDVQDARSDGLYNQETTVQSMSFYSAFVGFAYVLVM